MQRQYDIGQAFFDLPLEKKNLPKYQCNFAEGNFFGYRAVRIDLPVGPSPPEILAGVKKGR